jgi:hypothetical protein
MKLRLIAENMIMQQLRQSLHGQNFFNRPFVQTQPMIQPESGHDAGARTAGYSALTTGVPTNPRHRSFLGFEKRLGAIRL